ncbi:MULTISPECIES: tRNA (adenosine(37)-N6)-dimethylallyltransferase MiaA [unclassified Sphingomonas]|uniref:tRNA (adenosine(37)-N6)-dimethylallyltransferase MiaA n=1 Tax=unclassified Sphingomonas TaxID=196159 RepID=UPI000BC4FC53|nr:MAG: tRNA (adenosine(37)-N6)-dimethylallyltransferase MiaA [Sphingomonas sp. 32-62-10]
MNMAVSPLAPRVALIAGPTASGKSALAMALAEATGGTVINADSAQVYADLRVLSARPSTLDEARVPHRLFGHVEATDIYSAARWAIEATNAIDEAHADGSLPILVGGTGLYLRTLLDGIAPVPDIDPSVRAAVRALSVVSAYEQLQALDPAAADRLAPADTTRIARALEVVRSTGRTLADWQRQLSGGIAHRITLVPLILLPDRDWLIDRCDARLAAMFDGGAEAEVAALRARTDIAPNAPIMRAIGVREIAGWLDGAVDRATALAQAQLATRRYAKRQYTWFRHQPPIDWPRTDLRNTTDLLALAINLAADRGVRIDIGL